MLFKELGDGEYIMERGKRKKQRGSESATYKVIGNDMAVCSGYTVVLSRNSHRLEQELIFERCKAVQ